MLSSAVIGSQQQYYNQAFFSKLTKKRQKNNFLQEKRTTSFNVKCTSLVSNDGLNILIKAITCPTVLQLGVNIGNIMMHMFNNAVIVSPRRYYNQAFLIKLAYKRQKNSFF